MRSSWLVVLISLAAGAATGAAQEPKRAREPVRVGIVGLDTSHVVAFTRLLNDQRATGAREGVEVVAAYPAGSDIASSVDRIARYTREVRGFGVEIVDSLPELLRRVDAVMLESVDGRPHRTQAEAIFAAGKPVFIDKPLAASLADAFAIAELAERHGVPWFSSSSLRFGAELPAGVGEVVGCDAYGPCSLEPTHSRLFWYGIHGVETLFTVLGRGCERVSCASSDGADVATGVWTDGRIGTFRGVRDGAHGYGATIFGKDGIGRRGEYAGYAGLVDEIATFFKTGQPPVDPAETLEIYAFMAAAERSLELGGEPVALADVVAAARAPEADEPARPNILLCIADDWSWPHAGCLGDAAARTPSFDEVARRGVLFTNAFTAAPSCTASRAGILTGQAVHRLREGANLHGFLPSDIPVYPDLLEDAGYAVGFMGKGWGPGRAGRGGRARNPAGPRFESFEEFLAQVEGDRPFCFWFGSHDPHRPYRAGSGAASGMDPADVTVPPFLPDLPEVRADLLDYGAEVARFDAQVGEMLARLEAAGRLANTIVVVTSDNGMPFPRAKATVYDAGMHVPLAIQWPARLRSGHRSPAFVSLADLAPTFLEAAGVAVPEVVTAQSLGPLLRTGLLDGRRAVFLERERHAHARAGNLGYPSRAVRTARFLYVRNLRPDRWPAGDPEFVFSVGPFGDVDDGPTKRAMLEDRDGALFRLAFGKRPAEELYDLAEDPWQVRDVALEPGYADAKRALAAQLDGWMEATGDPRVNADDDRFDGYPYFGARARRR